MEKPSLISVVISTYNRSDALSVVLDSLCCQDDYFFEIVVADDGSTDSTRNVVEEKIKEYPEIRIIHSWQTDHGFRLALSRNNGFRRTSGDYIIFIDGDCLVPPDFISSHRKLAKKGYFVVGQRILTNKEFAESLISREKTVDWSYRGMRILVKRGNINRAWPRLNVQLPNWFSVLLRNGIDRVRGCNFAVWKEDFIKVNGYDENYVGWGSEDKDLACRLNNFGVSMKCAKFLGTVLHLWHRESSREKIDINIEKLNQRMKDGVFWASNGLKKDHTR